MHIAVEVMVAYVFKIPENCILAYPLEVIAGNGAGLLGTERVFVIEHNFIAVTRWHDPPVADGSRNADELVFEEDRCSVALAIVLQGIAFLTVECCDGAAMPTKTIACGISSAPFFFIASLDASTAACASVSCLEVSS